MLKAIRLLGMVLVSIILITACDESEPQVVDPETSATPPITLLWKTNHFPATPSPRNYAEWYSASTTPATWGDLLFLTDDDLMAPRLSAVEQQTGNVAWRHEPYKSGTRNVTSPVAADGFVLFGSSKILEWGPNDNHKLKGILHALDAQTGRELWQYEAGSGLTTPLIKDGVVYFGSWVAGGNSMPHEQESFIHAVELSTGALRWTLAYSNSQILLAPTLKGDLLYIVTEPTSEHDSAQLRAIDLPTQEERWHFDIEKDKYVAAPPVVHGELLYMLARGDKLQTLEAGSGQYKADGDRLFALNIETGQVQWSYSVGPSADDSPVYNSLYDVKPGILTAPIVSDGSIFFAIYSDLSGDAFGLGPDIQLYVLALDATKGQEQWRYRVEGEARATRVFASGIPGYFVFGNFAGDELRALTMRDGHLSWSFQTEESPIGPVIEENGNVYTVDYEGMLYALQIHP